MQPYFGDSSAVSAVVSGKYNPKGYMIIKMISVYAGSSFLFEFIRKGF